MSQLDLALDAGVSARHLSCIETGKARASRETIGRLADALGMPLRERNVLIRAGGFAPEYSESPLLTPTLDRMRGAIELILRHQEPYPAFVVSRHWGVLLANEAAVVFRSPAGELRFFETMTTFIGPRDVTLEELRIECSFPADEKTAAVCEQLRGS